MSVDFIEEDSFNNQNMIHQKEHSNKPWMVGFLSKIKIVNNDKQAEVLLLIISIIFLLISAVVIGYYLFGIGNPTQVKFNIPNELKTQMKTAGTALN